MSQEGLLKLTLASNVIKLFGPIDPNITDEYKDQIIKTTTKIVDDLYKQYEEL